MSEGLLVKVVGDVEGRQLVQCLRLRQFTQSVTVSQRSAGVCYCGRREGRQIEHVTWLIVGPCIQLVDYQFTGGVFGQAGRLSLDQGRYHQLAVRRQTRSQRVRLHSLR